MEWLLPRNAAGERSNEPMWNLACSLSTVIGLHDLWFKTKNKKHLRVLTRGMSADLQLVILLHDFNSRVWKKSFIESTPSFGATKKQSMRPLAITCGILGNAVGTWVSQTSADQAARGLIYLESPPGTETTLQTPTSITTTSQKLDTKHGSRFT